MSMIRSAAVLLMLGAAPALAADPVLYEAEGDFADIAGAVEDAIINAGLVIDSTSHVGAMLNRTKADVGGEKDIYTQADVFSFCSAVVSRKVMERDPLNIQSCPYGIFVYELADAPGKITVGHRDYAAEDLPEVQELITGIVGNALD